MNTTDLQKLIAFQKLILQYVPMGVQSQNGIPERVSFLEIWYPRYVKISEHYHVGCCSLRCIISRIAASDYYPSIAVAEKQANDLLEGWRANKAKLQQNSYEAYVNNTKRYNEKYRHHRNRKQKEILTAEAFIATLPDLFFI